MTCLARSQDPQDWRLSDLEPGLLRFDRIAQAVKVENNHPAFQWKKKIKQKRNKQNPGEKLKGLAHTHAGLKDLITRFFREGCPVPLRTILDPTYPNIRWTLLL